MTNVVAVEYAQTNENKSINEFAMRDMQAKAYGAPFA
jgi:hypothetical protein